MSARTYYFFCDKCGADTATYELISVCPYCHAGRERLKLIGGTDTQTQRVDMYWKLERMRTDWSSQHSPNKVRRHRWFRKA